MTFLNPLLLFGALGIAAPIIIHLLARQRVRRVLWAAMRFLRKADERNRQRMRLEEFLLLALRCLLFLLLAFALARPALRKGGVPGMRGGDEVALIVLDGSLSMAQTDGAASRFEQAQQAAEQILDALPGTVPVGVWLATEDVAKLTPEPTPDGGLARKLIRDAQRTDRGSDWPAVLAQAFDLLGKQRASVKRLFLITDGQAGGWKAVPQAVAQIKEQAKGVLTHVIIIGEPDPRNLAVTDLRLASAFAAVQEPLRFEVEVTNFGTDEVPGVTVSIGADSEPPTDEQVLDALAPGAAKRIALYAKFTEPGLHFVTARLAGDRCPADDARTLAVRVLEAISVLLVDGEPGSEPRESEVFYLRHALAPVPPEMRPRYVVQPRPAVPGELDALRLADFDAIVLANVVDLSDAAAQALTSYVQAGGGLIVFPGGRTNVSFYNAKLPWLPAAFGEARGDAEQANAFFALAAQGHDHPIVEIWREAAAGSLATAHFFRALHLAPRSADAAQRAGPPLTVLRYADGAPAVVERSFGAGRVVQFSSTADSAWNDLCARPVFVPLLHRTLGALLARHDDRLNLRTGTTYTQMMPPELAGKDVRVARLGEPLERGLTSRLRTDEAVVRLDFAETDRAGGYEVRLGDDAAPIVRFAAQTDPAESKLDPLTPAEIKALASVATITAWNGTISLRDTLVAERHGAEFWQPIAWIALLLAVAEMVLGNLWSRSK
jgi:hypothetical protein